MTNPTERHHRWDGFVLDVAGHRLSGADGDVHLEPQAFDVLVLLVSESARVVSKNELLDSVWGDQFVSESAVTTRIKQVRKALGDDGRTQKYVRNVHGRGYQFVGELAPSEAPANARSASPRPEVVQHVPDLAVEIAVDDEYPFVGRHGELERIDAVLRSGTATNGKVFIGGAPGSGKSRLAVEVARRAATAGTLTCAGRCEANVTSSLQPIRDAFAQLAVANPSMLPSWADGIEGQLMSLMPSLSEHLRHAPTPVDVYAGIDVFLTAFDRIAAGGPLIILIDDLQWSDEPTRAFLARLHRRLDGRAVHTLATYRSARSDLPDEVRAWIQGERRSHASVELALDNLDDAAAALIATVTGVQGEEKARELIEMTGGHSLFLTESLRDLQLGQATASSVNELINRRVGRQSDEVQRIIRIGAVLGSEFSFSVAAEAAGLPLDRALAAVDEAIDAELLHETTSPSRFRFSHQLVPQAIVEELGRSQRASAHAACADALRSAGADDVEVAFHSLGAVPLVPIQEAIEQSRAAASKAREANQFDRALRLLEAVLASEPQARARAEVLLEVGEILNQQGTPALALVPLEQVAETARRNGWPDLFVAAVIAHWNQSPFRRPGDGTTLRLLAEAEEMLGEGPSVEKARVIAKRAVFNIFRESLASRAAQIDRAMAMAEAVGTTEAERLQLLEWKHITFSCPAGASELDALDVDLERMRAASGIYFTDAAAPETSALMHGRGEELRRITQADDARLRVQPIAEWRDLTTRSTFAAFDGDIAGARDLCDRAATIGEAYWGESSVALHGFGQFFFDLTSGEWTHSLPLLELLAAFSGAHVFDGALIVATDASGDHARARALRDGLDLSALPTMTEHILGGNGLVGFAEAALLLDDDELAEAAASALRPVEHLQLGVPWSCSLAAADPLARLAARQGDDEAAARYIEIALGLYESLGAPALARRLTA